jgi:hypothetical protein
MIFGFLPRFLSIRHDHGEIARHVLIDWQRVEAALDF